MSARIGINGFARTGSMILRLLMDCVDFEITHINDAMGAERLADLLTHDIHGPFNAPISCDDAHLIINGKSILVTRFEMPEEIPWEATGVEYVIENHEVFKDRATLQGHFRNSVRKVILGYQPEEITLGRTIVMGVNEFDLQPSDDIISVADGAANCCAVMLKVLHDEFGVARGFMNAVQPATLGQRLQNGCCEEAQNAMTELHTDTTDALRAVHSTIPELRQTFDGFATTLPSGDASFVELTVELHCATTAHDVREAFRRYAEGPLSGVLAFTREPVAGCDVARRPHSALFNAIATKVIGGNLIQILGWFSAEASQSNRIIDILKYIQSYE